MTNYRFTVYCKPGYLAGDWTISDRQVTDTYGISCFFMEMLLNGEWIVIDECSGFAANMTIDELIDYADPEQGLSNNWINNLQVIDMRPDAVWSYECSDENADEIIAEQDILDWKNLSI